MTFVYSISTTLETLQQHVCSFDSLAYFTAFLQQFLQHWKHCNGTFDLLGFSGCLHEAEGYKQDNVL
jgi:hypothetical protein